MPAQNLVYLFAAYTIIWIVLFGYLFYLTQQVSDLRNQLDVLRRQRQGADGTGEASGDPSLNV